MILSCYVLRPILDADAKATAHLIRGAFGAITPALVPPPSALQETAESVAAQIAAGGGLVAEAPSAPTGAATGAATGATTGAIIGVILWGEREGGLYLGRLSVADPWRRAGVARALVMRGEAFARACGLPRVHVGVRLVLASNRRLFTSLGFCEKVLHSHGGFTHPTWVEMEKPLV